MQIEGSRVPSSPYWERKLRRYSLPAKLVEKLQQRREATRQRLAWVLRYVSARKMAETTIVALFQAVHVASVSTLNGWSPWAPLLDLPLNLAIQSDDVATAQMIITHAPQMVFPSNLGLAMEKNRGAIVEAMVKACIRWMTPDYLKDILFWACQKNHPALALVLIKQGVQGNGCLHYACYNGQLEVVRALLTLCSSLNEIVTDDLWRHPCTPLMLACRKGQQGANHREIALLLLENLSCEGDPVSLHLAVGHNWDDVAAKILERSQNVQALLTYKDTSGRTSLTLSMSNGHRPSFELLRQHGAPLEADSLNFAISAGWQDVIEAFEILPQGDVWAYVHSEEMALFLIAKGFSIEFNQQLACLVAVSSARFLNVLLLHNPPHAFLRETFSRALREGNLECLEILFPRLPTLSSVLADFIAPKIDDQKVAEWFPKVVSKYPQGILSQEFERMATRCFVSARVLLISRLFAETGPDLKKAVPRWAEIGDLESLDRVPEQERAVLLNDSPVLSTLFRVGKFVLAEELIVRGADPFLRLNEQLSPFHEFVNYLEKQPTIEPAALKLFASLYKKAAKKGFRPTGLIWLKLLVKAGWKKESQRVYVETPIPPEADVRFLALRPEGSDRQYTIGNETIFIHTQVINSRGLATPLLSRMKRARCRRG